MVIKPAPIITIPNWPDRRVALYAGDSVGPSAIFLIETVANRTVFRSRERDWT